MGLMSRAALTRLILALLILAGSVAVAVTQDPRLGLDLRGGTQIVLETHDSETVEADAEATARTLQVLRGRVDALGVAEPTLVQSGDNRIIVELPDLEDPREAARVIGQTAQLSFHPVAGVAGPKQEAKEGQRILPDESGQRLVLGPVAVPGNLVSGSDPGNDPSQGTGWYVTVDFKGAEGRAAWRELTAQAACAPMGSPQRRVAIVLDREIISSPQVVADIQCGVGMPGGSTQITGDFTAEEAKNLAILIEGGALPVPVEIIEQRVVGPTLGAEAIDASFKAGIIGLVLTGLFIAIVYRLMGVLATFALATYALISFAALTAIGATLTLPGLAGFVLAIGMAIDANVLIFERAREEYTAAERTGLVGALGTGFNKAWSAIIDSNVTTLLAAALLFFLASGPVKGFGVTLFIGVVASMISALVVARVLTEQAARMGWLKKHPKASGIATTGKVRDWLRRTNPDLMGRSKLWLSISAGALVLAFAGIVVNGLNLGVEFTGGRLMQYSTAERITAEEARGAVADAGFANAVVQEADRGQIAVRTGKISNQDQVEIREAIGEVAGGATTERDELIGPSLGDELRQKALIAFGIALLVQMLYLGIRFKWTIGASAVLAMFHDVIVVVGIFAWLGKPIDGIFLAAALTIIGLSVNDSVVVFDRIREEWSRSPSRDMAKVANQAALDTMPRTVNTGLGAMFILAALAVLGGDSLRDFAIALLLGLVVGTYSSVFTATPISLLLHRRWPLPKSEPKAKRGPRDPNDSGAVV
jgi:SecD/SecF fusion protein